MSHDPDGTHPAGLGTTAAHGPFGDPTPEEAHGQRPGHNRHRHHRPGRRGRHGAAPRAPAEGPAQRLHLDQLGAITENLVPAGDGKYDRETVDGRQEVLAIARRLIGTYTTERSEAQTLLDSVRAGTADLGKYAVARWSTRQELAIRAMAEFDHLRAEGRSLSVVEVDAR